MKYLQTNRHTYYFFVLGYSPSWMLDAPGACFVYCYGRCLHVVGFVLFIVALPPTDMPQFFFISVFLSCGRPQPKEPRSAGGTMRWMGCLPNNLAVSFNALQLQMMGHLSREVVGK